MLTATSPQSRNFRRGVALGAGRTAEGGTVERIATAAAMASLGARLDVAVPIAEQVAALTRGEADVAGAVAALMARPLREE